MTEDKCPSVDFGHDDRLLWTESMDVENPNFPLFTSLALFSLLKRGHEVSHPDNER